MVGGDLRVADEMKLADKVIDGFQRIGRSI